MNAVLEAVTRERDVVRSYLDTSAKVMRGLEAQLSEARGRRAAHMAQLKELDNWLDNQPEGPIMSITPDEIARVAHEVNRAYCQALGDDSQPPWEQAPQWQKDSALKGVELHMSGDHGPEASHESWMKQKLEEGWKYGAFKDPDNKQHPCIVPFLQLPTEQQAKDFIFRAVVQTLANIAAQKLGKMVQR